METKRLNLSKEQKNVLDQLITKVFITNCIAFNVADNEIFRLFFETLSNYCGVKYKVPCAKTMRTSQLKKVI